MKHNSLTSLLPDDVLVSAFKIIQRARTLDEKSMNMLKQGKIHFHISGPGHEAIQTATAMAMKPAHDWAFPYYRDLAFALQYGVTPYEVFLEHMHRIGGPSSNGRQMPSHFGHKGLRIPAQSSPTGTQFLQAVGTALGAVKDGTDEIVYASSGEGATSEGEFWEAINWACREKVPVLFLIQNNRYAISVPFKDQVAGTSIFEMTAGHPNLFRQHVDGTDFPISYKAAADAVAYCRSRKGPSLIEADVVRLFPHSSSDDPKKYREPEEIEKDRARDPLPKLESLLIAKGITSTQQIAEWKAAIKKEIDVAAADAEAQPSPTAETAVRNVFSPIVVVSPQNFVEPQHTGNKIVMVDAINHALHEEMAANPRMLLYGEDVADGKGGVFTATKGLTTAFGTERVFNSPLAEASILGTAIGFSIRGFKPVVEIQFGDYIWPAMMQIGGELVHLRYRSDGNFSCPVVIRVAVGGYIRGGLYHSQSIESTFAHIPGLWIAFPSNAADAKGLLKTACREDNPVLFCEHKGLYRQGFASSPEPSADYLLPFGVAAVRKSGIDISIVTWGMMVQRSLDAARRVEDRGISVEVIDLRTIIPWDREAVIASVKKTGKALVVHEDTITGGFGGEIVSVIADECFQWLDAPIKRVAAKDAPIPFAPALENAVLPQESDIASAIEALAAF
jgi:2-oxoisovalerate dehydrogenase E1 component